MKTTLLLWSFLVAHAGDPGKDSDLKCSQRTEAELGKDVTLDCYCEPRCDVTGENELKWKFDQNTFVLAYRGTHDTGHQDAQFKGRAHVTSTESLQDGYFPVTISKIRKSDEGTYTCHVGSKTCSVRLKGQVFELKCQQETVEVPVGHNVTLNCKSEPQYDLTGEIISWSVNSTIFFDFRNGKKYLFKQFKGRVHTVSDWDVSEGKLSVEISSISENDTGVYTCSVVHGPNCTVTLIVNKTAQNVNSTETPEAERGNTTTPPPSDDSNNGAIIGPVVAGSLLIVGLVSGLIYKKRRERGRVPVPTQDDRENNL